ncbi:protein O-GlcNAcase-like isoform X1 [Phaenicophaeus curvirostris]|uniref:protein O-GlcNAcase-like isoform X1 n=1 Tax=Phaenicophaeus curvirostris TaxID=33595 RepID=UPI0037F0BDD6
MRMLPETAKKGKNHSKHPKLKLWGLNCYMYAPKDELKHRLLWREPYTEHEAAQMQSLIEAAQEQGVEFVFAISAGQDMVFSSAGDRRLLLQKLRQVAAMGCRSFALLFDDIDPCMCQADRDVFPSLAQAQASVANEVYQELGQPAVFLFCPTEYCGSLCSPSPSQSCYLLTLGQELLLAIGVIWTGPKVVSQELSAAQLEEVEGVLRRRPIIWDNLYANDYDCRRVFLGPYTGRASGLMTRLQGLLLNPNCELQANFIPIHTLGSWFRSELGSCAHADRTGNTSLGMETAAVPGSSQGPRDGSYSPQEALEQALLDWVAEINRQALESGGRTRGQPSVSLKGGTRLQPSAAGGWEPTPDPQPHGSAPSWTDQCSPKPCAVARGDARREVTSEPGKGGESRSSASGGQSGTGDKDQLTTGSRAPGEPSSDLPSTTGSAQSAETPVDAETFHSPGDMMCCSHASQNLPLPPGDARTGGGSAPQTSGSCQPEASRADIPRPPPATGAGTSPGPPAPLTIKEAGSIPMAPLTAEEAGSGRTAPLTTEETWSIPTVPLTTEEARPISTALLTPEEAQPIPTASLTPEETLSISTAPLTAEEALSIPMAPLTTEEAGSIPMVLQTTEEAGSIPMTLLTTEEAGSNPSAPLTMEEAGSILMAPLTMEEAGSIPTAPLTAEEAESIPAAPLTLGEVRMLVELFYLPYHHGPQAQHLLEHFRWLRANSLTVGVPATTSNACGGACWRGRAQSFQQLCAQTCRLHSRFVSSTGQALLYDLHPYLWDIRNMLLAASAFVLWLDGHLLCDPDPKGTWGSCFGWCQSITAPVSLRGDAEPWVRRGGLFGELQALLPVGNSCDLFYHPPPLFPSSQLYVLRPLLPLDKAELYRMCRESLDCDPKVAEILTAHPDLLGDRLLGSFLSLSPEYTFVLEDEDGPCGYAAGALCAEGFLQQRNSGWLPAMQHKYPRELDAGSPALGQDALEEALLFFHEEPPAVPLPVLRRFPSLVQLGTAPRVLDAGVSRSLAVCLLSALRANGSRGVFCQVSASDRQQLSFYSKLGFVALPVSWGSFPRVQLLGRLL